MIDGKPYIIVDNQKIQPISRPSRPASDAGETAQKQEQTFGIVDRVTISREAREKSRQVVEAEIEQPVIENQSKRLSQNRKPMLTYSPKDQS